MEYLAIVSFDITKGTRGDAPILKKLIKGITKGVGDFCADPTAFVTRHLQYGSHTTKNPIHQTKEKHN